VPDICVEQEYVVYEGDGPGLQRKYEILTTCPDVKALKLNFYLSSCVVGDEPGYLPFKEGDYFPSTIKNVSM
jgi:hypothetical protein